MAQLIGVLKFRFVSDVCGEFRKPFSEPEIVRANEVGLICQEGNVADPFCSLSQLCELSKMSLFFS